MRLSRQAHAAPAVALFVLPGTVGYFALGGYRFVDWWLWAALTAGASLVIAAVDVARPRAMPPLPRIARTAIALAVSYAVWSALAVIWSSDRFAAHQEVVRTVWYVVLVLLAVRLVGSRRKFAIATATWLASVGVVVAATVFTVAIDHRAAFESARLIGPLAYANGLATFLFVPVPMVIALAADRTVSRELRAVLLAVATASTALGVLTQSRGGLVALAAGTVAAIGLSPSRSRVAVAAAVVLAPVAMIWSRLQDAYRVLRVNPDNGAFVLERDVLPAIALVACIAILAFYAWTAVDSRLTISPTAHRVMVVGAAAGLVVAAGAFASHSHLLEPDRERAAGRSIVGRLVLTSADDSSSARRDLWRIAVRDVRDHPLRGVGPDNFEETIYRYRTREFARTPKQAHQLTLEVLAERGVVGALLLFGFIATTTAAGLMTRSRAGSSLEVTLVSGALASCAVWFVHAQVDWTWHLAGATIPVTLLAGALLGSTRWHAADSSASARGTRSLALVIGATAVVLLVLITPLVIATSAMEDARRAGRQGETTEQVAAARRATTWAPHASESWLLRAESSLARGDGEEAGIAYEHARRADAADWRVHATAAAFYHASGDPDAAREAARQVRRLNPLYSKND